MSRNEDALQAYEDIRCQIATTRRDANKKIEAITSQVKNRVNDFKEGALVRIQDVKDELSVSRQTQRRPWWVFAGAVGVGFALGRQMRSSSTSIARFKVDSQNPDWAIKNRSSPAHVSTNLRSGGALDRVTSLVVDVVVHAAYQMLAEARERQTSSSAVSSRSGSAISGLKSRSDGATSSPLANGYDDAAKDRRA